ncbi:uncharacterized protein [Miscanthus floridulus]|uniref:uncharacterized protein isoform X1 n=1 Tax=Miscanthus floridulus TaxID=154761 RepID=UPI00345AF949
MATRRQREAAAPPPLQAANAASARPAAMEGDSLSRIMRDSFSRIMGDLQRLGAAINQLDSERAEKEAEVQKVMEELESEKAQKEAKSKR